MASGGWFSHNLKRHSIDEPSNKPSFDASASVSQADDGKAPADGRSLQRTVTAPLSTPHDAVMSELTGVTETDAARRSDAPSSPVPLNRDASTSGGGPAEDASTQDPGSAQAARSAATTPKPVPSSGIENVYDPYTGNIAGMLYPRIAEPTSAFDPDAATSSKKKDSLQVDADKDELWSHLARIRDLQGEIAGMHVRMEGVGSADGGRGGQKRPQGPGSRMRTDTIGAGDEWVDAEQEANARKKAKDAEFTKLAESFEGRRAAIDGMMDKLDDLSRALTTFHALPTPQIDMLFRSNTKDSSATSPLLRSPSPMFTNPASSPPPGSPPPMSPPPDYGRRARTLPRNIGVVKTDFGARSETLSPMSESPVSDIDGRV